MDADRAVVRDTEQRLETSVGEACADGERRRGVERREEHAEAAREQHPVVGRANDERDQLPCDEHEADRLRRRCDPGRCRMVVGDGVREERAGAEERQGDPAAEA